jgi:hypothetical protein
VNNNCSPVRELHLNPLCSRLPSRCLASRCCINDGLPLMAPQLLVGIQITICESNMRSRDEMQHMRIRAPQSASVHKFSLSPLSRDANQLTRLKILEYVNRGQKALSPIIPSAGNYAGTRSSSATMPSPAVGYMPTSLSLLS